ncbi:hypothetical protein BJX76DRAFT_347964 [Aspergillus varians]
MARGYSSAITLATVLVGPADIPTFRIMAGKCAWSCGLVICTCIGLDAPFQELLAENLPSTECPHCLHPLSDHGEVKSPLSTSHDARPERLQETTNHQEKGCELHFVSRRTDTVRILAELIDRENVVHVRGTPASGKTTLARLLQQYYNDQKRVVYFICNWKKLEDYPTEDEDEPWEKLTQIIRSRFKLTGRIRNLPPGTIIIVDEAQKIYSDTEFWNLVIKERIYGKDEFKDAVQQICADTKFEAGYLFSLTNGHPGGVEYLEPIPIYRSFPTGPLLSVQVAKVLRHVLEQGSIPVGKQEDITMADDGETDLEEAKDKCFVNGWLHKTLVPEDKAGKEKYVLPSRLHEKQVSLSIYSEYFGRIMLIDLRWVEWILEKQKIRLNSKCGSLRELCVDILKEFSAATLRHTAAGKNLTSAAQYKPLEAAYQDEFYRCFNIIAGRSIPEKNWAVEQLREEDRVHEHISRFHEGGGRYHSWVTDGMISDWIIINCATSVPTRCKFILTSCIVTC